MDKVATENIYLANGSGPILKQVIPHLIRREIKSRYSRVFKHLFTKNGYPLITPSFTYFKVPLKSMKMGLQVHLLETGPETGFALDLDALRKLLDKQDGLVYIANPNNPTGQLQLTREEIVGLVETYPRSTFWIDEAYVQYMPPEIHLPVSDLVPAHKNLVVSRSFSFAYGLAALHLGYLIAQEDLVKEMESQTTEYRIGKFQEEILLAAIADEQHQDEIRSWTQEAVSTLREGLEAIGGIESYPSHCNMLLCRFTDGRLAAPFAQAMQAKGIRIKVFKALGSTGFGAYFRVTTGIPEENQRLIATAEQVLRGA
jgi:histidinol-phosphate aminotransferase